MDYELILNVVIGVFIYNTILKSIGMSFLKVILNTDLAKEKSKSFKEKLADKINENK